MSEKKTAEIKLRIEPSRKARYQQAAADEEIGLSEWLVNCAEEHLLPQPITKREGWDFSANFKSTAPSVIEFPVATDEVPTKDRDSDWTGDWKPWGGTAA